MEVTKEQLEEVLRSDRTYNRPEFAKDWTEEDDETFTRETLKLALAHLDSTRARRVGEAVIASGITAEWCEKHLRDLRNARGSMSLSSPAYGRAFTQEIALFDAIAEALRGEP